MAVLGHDVAAEVVSPDSFMGTVGTRCPPIFDDVLETAVVWWRGKLMDEGGDEVYVHPDSS